MPGGALCKAQVASCVFKSASPFSSDGHSGSEFGGWVREPPWLRVSGCYRPCPGRQAASSGTKKRVSLCVGFPCVRWGADAAACRAVGEKRPALSAGLCPCALVSEGDAELALCPPPLNPRRGSQRLRSSWADVSFHIFLFFPRLPVYSSVDRPGSPEAQPRVGCLPAFQELGVVWGAVQILFWDHYSLHLSFCFKGFLVIQKFFVFMQSSLFIFFS